MRTLSVALAALVAALLLFLPSRPLSAAPPYTVTVVVTGDDAQGLQVVLGAPPFHPSVKITIGADNRGTGVVTLDQTFDVFAPNGFDPAQRAVTVTSDVELDFTYADPFGGGGGGGGGGALQDRLVVKKLQPHVHRTKALRDKLTLSAQIFTATGFPVTAANEMTLDISPAYHQVIGAGAFVAKGKSGRKFVFRDETTTATLLLRSKAGAKPDKLSVKRRRFTLGDDVGPKGSRTVRVATGAFDEVDVR